MTRRFTTVDLETLTEGTTPGPWTWHDSDDPDSRFIYGEEGNMCISVDSSGSDYRAADPHLMAAAPELAHTVIEQAAQIERVREALHRIERADGQAQHDWDTKADMLAQGAEMGYSMSAQWLEEALGDTDD